MFNRRTEKGKTCIRNGKMVEKVEGYEANTLYLWALDQQLPVGVFVHRKSENGFKPIIRDPFIKAYAWLDYLNEHENMSFKDLYSCIFSIIRLGTKHKKTY